MSDDSVRIEGSCPDAYLATGEWAVYVSRRSKENDAPLMVNLETNVSCSEGQSAWYTPSEARSLGMALLEAADKCERRQNTPTPVE